MNFNEYPDRDLLAIDVANTLAGALENSVLINDQTSFAVPGGTTPGPIFDALCAANLDWNKVHILLTDERWVPDDDPQSNAALVRRRLLTSRAAKAQFHPYFTTQLDLPEAAEILSRDLAHLSPLSVVLLGMGDDMHTASLFPNTPELAEGLDPEAAMFIPVTSQNPSRISLSAAVIDGALSKHLVIYGDAKRAAFEAAQELPSQEAPIAAVLSDLNVHWAP